jgi:hypothetical protein
MEQYDSHVVLRRVQRNKQECMKEKIKRHNMKIYMRDYRKNPTIIIKKSSIIYNGLSDKTEAESSSEETGTDNKIFDK